MDNLPVEALYTIVCNLPLNHMFTVNRQFNRLYTEHYYKYYLHNKYTTLSLRVKTTYKDLCRDSLKEGSLTLREKNKQQKILPISGLKAAKCAILNSLHLVLRFNNDLYLYNDETGETLLIDEDITDFDTNTYIKENKWYYLYEFEGDHLDKAIWNNRVVKDINKNFRHVAYCDDFVCATTDNTLYRLKITTKTVTEHIL
jgi:hypothetical protein